MKNCGRNEGGRNVHTIYIASHVSPFFHCYLEWKFSDILFVLGEVETQSQSSTFPYINVIADQMYLSIAVIHCFALLC